MAADGRRGEAEYTAASSLQLAVLLHTLLRHEQARGPARTAERAPSHATAGPPSRARAADRPHLPAAC